MALSMCTMNNHQNLELTDEATNADNVALDYPRTPVYRTRRAGYTLNQKKLVKNLKKDAIINTFDTVFNNHNENVSIKCNSGFFLEVIGPCFHDLAKKSAGTITINNFRIICTNDKISLDQLNLNVNSLYRFDILSIENDSVVANVTVHCHITTKLVRIQGSKLVDGIKAPVWFYNLVLKDTLEKLAEERKTNIENANKIILDITDFSPCPKCNKRIVDSDKFYSCTSCAKIFHKRCTLNKSDKSRSQPNDWTCESCSSHIATRVARKRPITSVIPPEPNEVNLPPAKALAMEDPTEVVLNDDQPLNIRSALEDSVPKSIASSMSSSSPKAVTFISPDLSPSATSGPVNHLFVSQPTGRIPLSIQQVVSTSSLPSPVSIEPYLPPQLDYPTRLLNVDAHPFLPTPVSLSVWTSTAATSVSSSISSVLPITSTSSALSAPVVSSGVSSVPSVPKATPGNKVSKSSKTKSTLATNPEEFEKENLRVERDTCKLKLVENDNKIKALKEQLEIYMTRCSLLEKKRNDDAYERLTTPAVSVPPPSLAPRHDPRVPDNAVPSQGLSSSIESLVNLEVLKVVKAATTTAPSQTSSESENIQQLLLHLELKFSAKIDELKTEMINLFTNKPQQITKTSTSTSTQTELPFSSSEGSKTFSFLSPQFSFPPPPIKRSKTCSSQTDPLISRTIASPAQTKRLPVPKPQRKSSPKSQSKPSGAPPPVTTTSSILGNPPSRPRVIGSIPSLSPAFILAHGNNNISEKVKSVNIKKRKKPEKKRLKKINPCVNTAVLVDITADPGETCTLAPPRTLSNYNSRRTSKHPECPDLIDLDSPEVSNQFGEPLSEDTPNFNLLESLNC